MLVGGLEEPEGVREHPPLPELKLDALAARLEVHPVPLSRVEHGLGKDAVRGAPEGAAAAAGGRRRGHGAGADLVLVPEPHHRGAAGPHAVMAGALEGAPHGELQLEGGAALAPGDRGEVLATVHAQGPAHDPVWTGGGARQPGRPRPGLDHVPLTGEEPSQP